MTINCVPYVPGCAKGKLLQNWRSAHSLMGQIIVIQRYSLGDILSLSSSKPEGIIVVGNERFSHLLIYLFSLTIPTVLIDYEPEILESSFILIDGTQGQIEICENNEPPKEWDIRCQRIQKASEVGEYALPQALTTIDGITINLGASVSSVEGVVLARNNKAIEISLVRSEFLWTGTGIPRRKYLFKEIEKICQAAFPLNVTIRLFDVGGDKAFDWVEGNADIMASLGLRGCRSYQDPVIYKVIKEEVEAVAELASRYNLGLLIPYVTTINEFKLLQNKIQTISENPLSIGAVLETPAACMDIDSFLNLTENVYLGTNDILECFFGANRTLKSVAQYLNPYSPDLFRFLSYTAALAAKRLDRVGICGQLPLFPHVIKILIGLGYRRFSVEPSMIPFLEATIAKQSFQDLQDRARKAITCSDAEELFNFYQMV